MAQLAVGLVLGWTIWSASVSMTGTVEPWDSPSNYYRLSGVVAGMASSLFRWRRFYWGPVGVWLGQVAYIELIYSPTLPASDPRIFPSFIAVLLFGSFWVLVGGLVGGMLGYGARRALGRREEE